ncbi:MAG: hypothetical protein JEZ03_13160 [Bacteroidales bacterium]|nr:hypothetical protein [Bacteroidales bacterium]
MTKKSLLLLNLLIAGVLMFTSCNKDEDENFGNPSIEFGSGEGLIASDSAFAAGETFKINIIAKWNGNDNLTNYVVYQNNESIENKGINASDLNQEVTITKTDADQDIIKIEIRDAQGHENVATITLTKSGEAYGPIKTYEVILGAQGNFDFGSSLSLVDGTTPMLAVAATVSETIDIMYYFDSESDKNTLASPGANIDGIYSGDNVPENWVTKNETRYSATDLEIDATAFNAMENDELIIANLVGDDGKRKAKKLSAGKYFAFKTANEKSGLLRVEEVIGQAEGTIKVTFKVQE